MPNSEKILTYNNWWPLMYRDIFFLIPMKWPTPTMGVLYVIGLQMNHLI